MNKKLTLKITKLPKALENEAPPRLAAFLVALTKAVNDFDFATGPGKLWGCEFMVMPAYQGDTRA